METLAVEEVSIQTNLGNVVGCDTSCSNCDNCVMSMPGMNC